MYAYININIDDLFIILVAALGWLTGRRPIAEKFAFHNSYYNNGIPSQLQPNEGVPL